MALSDELERIKDNIEAIRASISSLLASHNSNNVVVIQKLTTVEAWQVAHEKQDDDRWAALDRRLDDLREMVEAIPVEIGKDLGRLDARVTENTDKIKEHEEVLQQTKGAWRVLTIAGSAALALLSVMEFLLHRKGG